jgi:hypothetical protein
MKSSLKFALLYAICVFFLFPVASYFIHGHQAFGSFWLSVLIKLSGPALLYLGLVLQRTGKPVPIYRRIIGILIFLTGFAWLFSLLEMMG